ncbi:hypothetical protein TEA_016967 [Camellia sinensis var. sinensis]|uniref:Starch synthase catalytic domain-containing protein n=1 Tax=Camellia sinensis var. sinensis TaxID=542762 RepID=A0A4S4DT06_CAMSN|nr:hypothetical protein TEA_016967 [Camellia sinensis var. sinensis]
MATVTASRFVSRSSNVNSGGETVTNLGQIGLKRQTMTHNGLRSLNKLDMLQMKKNAKAIAKHASNKNGPKTENDRPSSAVICGSGMNIVFVGAEVGPWSKTGGLGDVLGGLPPAMAANGNRVMTVSPRYDQYKDAWDTHVLLQIKIGDRIETVRFFHCYKRGVDRVFVDHPMFLEKVWGKTGSKIYGPKTGVDYQDNQIRFSILCQVPIVASTGGLVDTVKEGYTGFQMGAFDVDCDAVDPADVDAVATTVTRALATYGTPALKEMIQNCMAQDLSWKGPAKKWEQLLLGLEVAGSEPGIEGEEIAPLAKENVATP